MGSGYQAVGLLGGCPPLESGLGEPPRAVGGTLNHGWRDSNVVSPKPRVCA